MSAVGRNDPCPCGSGRKFKKCCLGRGAEAPGAYTREERQSALERLARFTARGEFAESRAVAEALFWGEWLDRHSADDLKRAMALEESRVASEEWFAFDFRLGSGGTPVDLLLEREGDRLRSGERRYLGRMGASELRPYEVVRVRPEEGLDLRDLWTRQTIRVRERLGTRQLVRFDLVVARIVLGEAGQPVLDGLPYLFPATGAEPILKNLRRMHRRFQREFPGRDIAAFFKTVGMVYHHLWLDLVALRPLPRAVTAEGDDVVLARVIFDVRDEAAVAAALAAHPELERQDDGSHLWLEPGEEFRRGLGTVVRAGPRLVFEAISQPRAERGRRFLEGLAGEAAQFRAIEYESVERAIERTKPRPDPEPPDIPPEVEAQVVGEFYERHYRGWLDAPLPALSGRTPRQAASHRTGRPRLIALLKEMEVMSARQRRAGRPAYDFGWMWAELGLERP
ncbi:MAG: YecA family protein [Candidatus Rokuibacteriota bacterium]